MRFAAAEQRCGIHLRAFLHDLRDDLGARRVRQRLELGEFGFDRVLRIDGIDRDQDRAASGRRRSISQESPSL